MLSNRVWALTPAKIILGGFFLIITAGALLLTLPISSKSGEMTPFIDAFFTATSATCVTGLVVHDTYTYWSVFGQSVILLLIQIGGMGVVTLAIAITILSGRKIGLKQRFVMQESISAPQVGGIVRMTNFIIKGTLLLELIGAFIMAVQFCPQFGVIKGIWFSIFHSISAFCNAGFDLMGGTSGLYSSLTSYHSNPLIVVPVMLLIVVGGIGFFVWDDIIQHRETRRAFRLQTKVVLTYTFFLILIPAVIIFLTIAVQPNQPLLKDYQQKRILAWLEPEKYTDEDSYQQLNSVKAIGSGQLLGKGYDNDEATSVKNGNFVSEPQTDFIFAIIGEELGFVGCCVVIFLLLLIVIDCILIGLKAKDTGGRIICGGVASLVGIQTFINISVTTMIFPNTGLSLPFVSYGLTSIVCFYMGIGFVLNVGLQPNKYQ